MIAVMVVKERIINAVTNTFGVWSVNNSMKNFKLYIRVRSIIVTMVDEITKGTIREMVAFTIIPIITVLVLYFEGKLGGLTTELILMYVIDVLLYGVYKVLKSG
jgi:hypothetical protein